MSQVDKENLRMTSSNPTPFYLRNMRRILFKNKSGVEFPVKTRIEFMEFPCTINEDSENL